MVVLKELGIRPVEAYCVAVELGRDVGVGFEEAAEVMFVIVSQFSGNFFYRFVGTRDGLFGNRTCKDLF